MSQTVREWLRRGPVRAQILATFEHACNLITPSGEVITLVTPSVGNGPLNVVLEPPTRSFSDADLGPAVDLTEEWISVGSLNVDLRSAAVWDPRPDWGSFCAHRDRARTRLPALRNLCVELGSPDSLISIFVDSGLTATANPVIGTIRDTLALLAADWDQSARSLREAGRGLTGLGAGLTPSGDDFLIGWMLWTWLGHQEPARICQILTEASSSTTSLSSALLRAAARGECNVAWHALLEVLCDATDSGIEAAARQVLAYGATSGADALTGFLWAGLNTP